jgi:hypothetical protein
MENLDNAAAETIEIELKHERRPSVVAVAQGSTAAATMEPVPGNLEPHHHVTFENQYVRVMEVIIDPGDTTAYPTHSHDTLFVRLSESKTQSQTMDENWGPPHSSKPGEVVIDNNAKKPWAHRAKNTGATPFPLLAVEVLP